MRFIQSIRFQPMHHHKITLTACLLFLPVLFGCGKGEGPAPNPAIICGTSLIADMVRDLSSLEADTYTLLPSTSCPSQFDMKAGDIAALEQAKCLLLHPWQPRLANIGRVLDAARLPAHKKRVIEVEGNWMVPEVQRTAVTAVLEVLVDIDPADATAMREKAAARLARIDAVTAAARERLPLEKTKGRSVLCHEMQAPFLKWAGFTVVDTFNRPEDYSVTDMETLIRAGKASGVALVADNLQSGGLSAGELLARDIGTAYLVLSNFPGGFPDTPTWQAAFEENIRRLAASLEGPPAS